ncbi:hypothetical protein IWX64_000897 [Arthrobacter sp. CAN_A212]
MQDLMGDERWLLVLERLNRRAWPLNVSFA